jgi:hypothetical protein
VKNIFVITIVLMLISIAYWCFWSPVYITFSGQSAQQQDSMVYFWAPRRHRDYFSIGTTYQLQAEQQKIQYELFSISYATLKPDAVKLGFQPRMPNEDLKVNYQYRVTKYEEIASE